MSCTGNDSEAQDSQTNKPIVALRTVGLNNLGNTCYFNAAVQCLARARPLRQALKGLVLDENGPNILAKGGSAPVSRELFATLRGLTKAAALGPADGGKKGRKGLDPTGLLESIRRVAPQFRGRAQQDSHELVCALLSECDEELRRARKASNRAAKSEAAGKKDSSNDDVNGRNSSSDEEADQDGAKTDVETPSLIDQTFGANLWNVISCGRCGFESLSEETAFCFSLDIPGAESAAAARGGGGGSFGGGYGRGSSGKATKREKRAEMKANKATASRAEGKAAKAAAKAEAEAKALAALAEWEGDSGSSNGKKGGKGSKKVSAVAAAKLTAKKQKQLEKEEARAKKLAKRKGTPAVPLSAKGKAAPAEEANENEEEEGGAEEDGKDEEEEEEEEEEWGEEDADGNGESAAGANGATSREVDESSLATPAAGSSVDEAAAAVANLAIADTPPTPPPMQDAGSSSETTKAAKADVDLETTHSVSTTTTPGVDNSGVTDSSQAANPATACATVAPREDDDVADLMSHGWLKLCSEDATRRTKLEAATLPPLLASEGGESGVSLENCLARFTAPTPLQQSEGSGFRCPACHARSKRAKATSTSAAASACEVRLAAVVAQSTTLAAEEASSGVEANAQKVVEDDGEGEDKKAEGEDGDQDDSDDEEEDEGERPEMQDGTHRMALASAPPVLVLHLKRLLPFAKVHTHVDAPLRLDLAPYMVSPKSNPAPLEGTGEASARASLSSPLKTQTQVASPALSAHQPPVWYSLFGITEHAGGRSGGHYVMHGHGGNSDEWVTVSDSSVTPMSASAVRQKQAYMLWYAKE